MVGMDAMVTEVKGLALVSYLGAGLSDFQVPPRHHDLVPGPGKPAQEVSIAFPQSMPADVPSDTSSSSAVDCWVC